MPSLPPLPIDQALPALGEALDGARAAVLSAPPGSGKTTRVPPFLAGQDWARARKILVLEPRRLAARAAARRIAAEMGEAVGATAGYRVRFDTAVGPKTRIELITEGILTRMIQSDPGLEGVGGIVFDEFHERSLDGDLGLALALECRVLNPDLRLLVMSATLDTARIAALLGGAPVVEAGGRSYPVVTEYLPPPTSLARDRRAVPGQVASAVGHALDTGPGSVLAFLPGQREIEETAALLARRQADGTSVLPLYGNLAPAAQDAAITPAPPGQRKVVLATNIAETSLTIEGVTQVVDCGLVRRMRYDPGAGMGRMETARISRASADQRRGRAGRTGPGRCLRLWSAEEDRALAPFDPPEIAIADLAPLALDLACWGARPDALAWIDPPPAGAYAAAEALLRSLGAVTEEGRVTAGGRAMAEYPLHPRLAHMVLSARHLGQAPSAMALATLIEERPANPGNDDLDRDLQDLRRRTGGGRMRSLRRSVDALLRRFRLGPLEKVGNDGRAPPAGTILAAGFADRVARRREGAADRYITVGGRGVALAPDSRMRGAEWIVCVDLSMRPGGDAMLRRGAVLDEASMVEIIGESRRTERRIEIDLAGARLRAVEVDRLGAIVLARRPWRDAGEDLFHAALLEGIERAGVGGLPWTEAQRRYRLRLQTLHAALPDAWPDMGDEALSADLAVWLGPYLGGVRTFGQLRQVDLSAALTHRVGWERAQAVDGLAPERIALPSGRRAAVDYTEPGRPRVSAKLQELFGWQAAPVIADGRCPVTVELLSPAGRPLGISRDLDHFWRVVYPDVRKEMRGRYPKHPWPEDPMTARATALTKRRLDAGS